MMFPPFLNEAWTAALVNHLWQSTVVVLMAWLLTLILRSNHAAARYWVWMIASVKFVIPFSGLITAGEWLRTGVATPIQRPVLAAVMQEITQPFPRNAPAAAVEYFGQPALVAAHHTNLLPAILIAVWLCGFFAFTFSWARKWWQIRAAVRASSPINLQANVTVLSSPGVLEPGIFGIVRPVLLLPKNISDRLSS